MRAAAEIPVFIDEAAVKVPDTATVIEAVAGHDAAAAAAVRAARAYVTDGVGRVIDPESRLAAGAILRVIHSAPRASSNSASPLRS